MKRIIFICFISLYTSVLFSQLKVTTDSKLGIGLGSQTPVSRLAVGAPGDNSYRFHFESDLIAMRVHTTGNGSSNTGNPAVAIQAFGLGSSKKGDIGVQAGVG